MNGTATEISQTVNLEQKRAALEAVLHSHTFARADQLKSFLKYVCEMEFAGRGGELTEYLIGVEALGRPSNYSPSDDSAVRNRAFALRKKLLEFYDHEHPDGALRIELTKGSYCPHFVEYPFDQKIPEVSQKSPEASFQMEQFNSPPTPVSFSQEVSAPIAVTDRQESKKFWKGFVGGGVFASLAAGLLYLLLGANPTSSPAPMAIAPILGEVWGPILGHNADVLVSVANQPSLSVHPKSSPDSSMPVSPSFNDPGARPLPRELYSWYQTKYPTPSDNDLTLTLTTNATYWGDALAAMTALKTILATGTTPQLFPEKVITVPTLRRRNVILFGAPEYSPAIQHFLEKCPLTVNYLDAIFSTEPGKAPQRLYGVRRDPKSRPVQTYGLITVLPSESTTNQQHRTVIFSGVNSAGTQAAAEFFTSPEHLIALKKQMQKNGHEGFPPAYQVVVRSETDDSILLNFHYETYRSIPIPTGH